MYGILGVEGSKRKARTRERALANSVRVSIATVHYTQDSGFASFSDGRPVVQTMREILTGALPPQSLPLLRCVRSPDGVLYSLDNRRLYCFRECGVGQLRVELIENDDGANQEFWCKRFGIDNGTTSQGRALKLKADPAGGKRSAAMVAALLPCGACGAAAVQRLRRAVFEKGSKFATLPPGGADGGGGGGGCAACVQLLKLLKREKPLGGGGGGGKAKGSRKGGGASLAGGALSMDELNAQLAALRGGGRGSSAGGGARASRESSRSTAAATAVAIASPPSGASSAGEEKEKLLSATAAAYGAAFCRSERGGLEALLARDAELLTPRGASSGADATLDALLVSRARMAPALEVGEPTLVSADSAEVTFAFTNKQGATVMMADVLTVQCKHISSIARRKKGVSAAVVA